ncbi:MAG: MBL fold metallo-hydrolase [Bacteroidota bacterium]|nr:MBL fold metallo-hydrolase [Bacteroidota bacterium]MDX5431603.1 MBL fold metallo-hydrolase [Bacteroidota bacterium]MDX5470324.1 MBL fold metallo-hydrolase [Bacteroidota bacterium]
MLHIHAFTVNPFSENTYLVYSESGEAALFDPGFSNAFEQSALLRFLEDNNLRLTQLFLTHAHIDHILGYHWVNDHFKLTARGNEKEIPVFQRGKESSALFGIPYTEGPGMKADLHHGDTITIAGETWQLREAPGHSPGSLLFVHEGQGWVICGDVIFRESIGRTDLPGGNYETLMNSIANQVYSLPDHYRLFPGHGPETSVGYEKENNPFIRA